MSSGLSPISLSIACQRQRCDPRRRHERSRAAASREVKASLKRERAVWVIVRRGRPEFPSAPRWRRQVRGWWNVKVVAFSPTHTAEKFVNPCRRAADHSAACLVATGWRQRPLDRRANKPDVDRTAILKWPGQPMPPNTLPSRKPARKRSSPSSRAGCTRVPAPAAISTRGRVRPTEQSTGRRPSPYKRTLPFDDGQQDRVRA